MRSRLLLILLLLLVSFSLCSAQSGTEAEEPALEEVPNEPASVDLDHLVVGNPTPMRGDFFTSMWGNATSDIDVRTLIHGYNLVIWHGEEGTFVPDPSVVESITVMENDEGDRSYLLTIYDDLYYSDGTKITARDYAFSFLLQIAPEIEAIGGNRPEYNFLLGYDEYIRGISKVLPGVRVLNENALLITIDHNSLPFFYEMGLLWCYPYPIHVIAPGVAVKDDGDGVYLANIDESVEEPLFTAQLLTETILDPQTGYLSHPSVTCGPYVLSDWNGETAELVINPYFIGDYKGDKPLIRWLTYTLAENDTMIGKLQSGEFGLLNKAARADVIEQGLEMMRDGAFRMNNYPRIGLSYISFRMEKPEVSSEAVRQAIAWCMDRDQIITDYTSNFGLRADSYYGIGQWMYGIIAGSVTFPIDPPEDETDEAAMAEYEEALEEWEKLGFDNLVVYEADVDRANELLDADGWARNAEGIRQKVIDGETVVLDLKMIYPEGNDIDRIFKETMIPNLEKAGIRLTMEPMHMFDLLSRFYQQVPCDAEMIYMASNFDEIFDPSSYFQTDAEGRHSWSFTNGVDEEMYQLTVDMIRTEPGETLEYIQKWLKFLEHFNQKLPMIPVYTNIYFDFYTSWLQNYYISQNVTWGQAIIGAALEEPLESEDKVTVENEFEIFE